MTRRSLTRWAAGLATASALLAGIATAVRRGDPPPALDPPPAADALHSMRGLRHDAFDGERLVARITAASVAVVPARLWAPFRLGPLREIVAREVEVVYVDDGSDEPGLRASALQSSLEALAERAFRTHPAAIDVEHLRVLRRTGSDSEIVLEARACRSGVLSGALTCSDGVVRADGALVPFQQARYERGHLRLLPPEQQP